MKIEKVEHQEFVIAHHPKATIIEKVLLNRTDKVCKPLGFCVGEQAIHNGETVTIQGAAPDKNGEMVLWYSYDRLNTGEVCHYGSSIRNLREAGFMPVPK